MAMTGILGTAISALQTSQAALRTTAENIANVNTPGYVRREIEIKSRITGSVGNGVEIGSIRRTVDTFLRNELITASSSASFFEVQRDIHDRLQTAIGNPASDSSVNALVNRVFRDFADLALGPSDIGRRIGVVEDLSALASEINRLANEIQKLRQDADNQIATDLVELNSALQQIHDLNALIARGGAVDENTAALRESRDRAVDRIDDLLDVRVVESSDGSIEIFTTSGLTILDKSLRRFTYAEAGQVSTATRFAQIAVERQLVGGTFTPTGDVLDTALRGGELRGLIEMRDKELPEIALSYGEFATQFVNGLNAVHNQNSSVPPPNSMVGRNTGLLSTDAHRFTGQASFAVLDSNNNIAAQHTVDFTSGALTTIGDVIAAVNTGLGGAGTLSLSNGVLTFAAASGTNGVAMLDDATSPSRRGGIGFGHFFGLNDLLQARSDGIFSTGFAAADAHGFGTTGTVNIELRGVGGTQAVSHTLDFSSIGANISAIVTDLNTAFSGTGTFALDATGRLGFSPAAGFEDFQLFVQNDTSNRGTTGRSFTQIFGFTADKKMDPAFEVAVRSDIRSNPVRLAAGRLDLAPPTGTPALNSGDNRGAVALQGAQNTTFTFQAAGDLTAISTTLDSYAAAVISTIGQEANRITTLSEDRGVLRDEVQRRLTEESGVNLDEELADVIVFQTSYNAAARLITVTNELFDTLLTLNR